MPTTLSRPPLSPSVLLGVVRPAYHTAAAADATGPTADADRRKWGRYWATLAAAALVEAAVLRMWNGGGSGHHQPARSPPPPPRPGAPPSLTYSHARLAFIIWLVSPRTRGAARLYGAAVRPAAAAAAPWVAAVSADVAALLEKTGLATLADGIHLALTSIPGLGWVLGGGDPPPPDAEPAAWKDEGGKGARAARAAKAAAKKALGAARRVVTGGGGEG
jgi:hypothetical protein